MGSLPWSLLRKSRSVLLVLLFALEIASDPSAAEGFMCELNGSEGLCVDGLVAERCELTTDAILMALDAEAGDKFGGGGVAVSGDRVLVGAPEEDGADVHTGAVYVFRRDGDAWIQEAKLTASDASWQDVFGSSVDIDGDVAVVGATQDDDACFNDPTCNSGSAYVYRFDGSQWIEEAKLTASDGAEDDKFGVDVAIEADVVVVGSLQRNNDGPGAAYVYRYNGFAWTEETKLTAPLPDPVDVFGVSVSLSGETLIVGAPGDDDHCPTDPECDSGAATPSYAVVEDSEESLKKTHR